MKMLFWSKFKINKFSIPHCCYRVFLVNLHHPWGIGIPWAPCIFSTWNWYWPSDFVIGQRTLLPGKWSIQVGGEMVGQHRPVLQPATARPSLGILLWRRTIRGAGNSPWQLELCPGTSQPALSECALCYQLYRGLWVKERVPVGDETHHCVPWSCWWWEAIPQLPHLGHQMG